MDEAQLDNRCVDNFAAVLKKKLAKGRAKGRSGWIGAGADHLNSLLLEHILKGDPVDVAAFAMFIHQNGYRTYIPKPAERTEVQLKEAVEEFITKYGQKGVSIGTITLFVGASNFEIYKCCRKLVEEARISYKTPLFYPTTMTLPQQEELTAAPREEKTEDEALFTAKTEVRRLRALCAFVLDNSKGLEDNLKNYLQKAAQGDFAKEVITL